MISDILHKYWIVIFLPFLLSGCNFLSSGSGERDTVGFLEEVTLIEDLDLRSKKIESYLFFKSDLPILYETLSISYPDDTVEKTSFRGTLFKVLENIHDETTPAFIEDVFPKLPENSFLQVKALSVLTHIASPEALRSLLDIFADYSPDLEGRFSAFLKPLSNKPKYLSVLFPKILTLLDRRYAPKPIFELMNFVLEKGDIPLDSLKTYIPVWINAAEVQEKKVRHLDPRDVAFQDNSDYLYLYMEALSHFGHMPDVQSFLSKKLNSRNHHIKLRAIKACLRADIPIPTQTLESLASNPVTRTLLWSILEEQKKLALFPDKYNNRIDFAIGDLASWLYYEKKTPDHYRFRNLGTVTRYTIDGIDGTMMGERIYVLEFPYRGRWLLATSGPQPADTTKVGGEGYFTKSVFKKLGKRSIVEGVKEIW